MNPPSQPFLLEMNNSTLKTAANVIIALANLLITFIYFLPLMIEIFGSGGGGFGYGLMLIPFLVVFHILTLVFILVLIWASDI